MSQSFTPSTPIERTLLRLAKLAEHPPAYSFDQQVGEYFARVAADQNEPARLRSMALYLADMRSGHD